MIGHYKINKLIKFLSENNLQSEASYLADIIKLSGDTYDQLLASELQDLGRLFMNLDIDDKASVTFDSLMDVARDTSGQQARTQQLVTEHNLSQEDAEKAADIISGVSPEAERRAQERTESREIPVAQAGEFILPKMRFESVPCSSCATEAIKEAKDYWKNGYYTETSPETYERQKAYWEFTNINNSADYNNLRNKDRWMDYKWITEGDRNNIKNTHHWSAVFISFVMAKYDGQGADWYIYESHRGYIRDGKRKRDMIEENPNDHIGKLYYVYFPMSDINKYNLGIEPGDVVGRGKHMDIFVGNGMIIGGNSWAKNDDIREHSGGERGRTGSNTSGEHPINMSVVEGVIKRIRVLGPGSENSDQQVV